MALGVNVARARLIAMAVSSFLTALAGTFYAQFCLYIHPKSIISLDMSFEIAFIALIGGRGSIAGPILGALAAAASGGLLSHLFWRYPAGIASDYFWSGPHSGDALSTTGHSRTDQQGLSES